MIDRPKNRMLPLAVALFLVGGIGFLLSRFGAPSVSGPLSGHDHQEEAPHAEDGVVRFEPEALRLADLGVSEAAVGEVRGTLTLSGQVAPNPEGVAKVTSRVEGKIVSIRANVGDAVRPGQVLATVESAKLAAAQADYRQAVARRALAVGNLDRQRRLAALGTFGRGPLEEARTREIEARQQAEEADHHRETTQAAVVEAAREVEAREAAMRQVETELEVARRAAERARTLFAEQVVSRQDFERAEANLRLQEQARKAAHANVEKARAAQRSAVVVADAAQAEFRLATQKAEVLRGAYERERRVAAREIRTTREVAEAEGALRKAELDVRASADAVRLLGGSPAGGNTVAIAAPMAGRITERSATLGETVTTAQPIFSILSPASVWIELAAYPKDLPFLRIGLPVRVQTESVPALTFRGTISNVSAVLDPETRTARVRCVIANPEERLKPGMFVAGRLVGVGPSTRRTVTVPVAAVQELEGRRVVFVLGDEDGEFRTVPVETGREAGGSVEILSGLEPGDRYVSRNALVVKAQAMRGELGHDH